MSSNNEVELIATAGFGLEAVVARELKGLGYDRQSVADGRVTFLADLNAICRTNLWLRSSDRVLVKVGSFEARDFGELFDRTTAFDWSRWISSDGQFPVSGKSVRSQLHSVRDCQAIVKKAIVEKLKKTHRTAWFSERGPLFAVEVSILKDRVTLSIDTTGPSLHKRGYRTLVGPAPLKETLAGRSGSTELIGIGRGPSWIHSAARVRSRSKRPCWGATWLLELAARSLRKTGPRFPSRSGTNRGRKRAIRPFAAARCRSSAATLMNRAFRWPGGTGGTQAWRPTSISSAARFRTVLPPANSAA